MFHPRSRIRADQIQDGLTNTLAMAEVKAYNPYYRNAAITPAPAMPDDPADICGMTAGAEHKVDSGHTEWVDGRAHQIGFTTTFPPNTKVPCTVGGVTYDVDWTNQQEGKSPTVSTVAAVTARRHHSGTVNILLMDGGVRSVGDGINLGIWQALSTRAGKEILPEEFHKR